MWVFRILRKVSSHLFFCLLFVVKQIIKFVVVVVLTHLFHDNILTAAQEFAIHTILHPWLLSEFFFNYFSIYLFCLIFSTLSWFNNHMICLFSIFFSSIMLCCIIRFICFNLCALWAYFCFLNNQPTTTGNSL
jgi:hypothetical protein